MKRKRDSRIAETVEVRTLAKWWQDVFCHMRPWCMYLTPRERHETPICQPLNMETRAIDPNAERHVCILDDLFPDIMGQLPTATFIASRQQMRIRIPWEAPSWVVIDGKTSLYKFQQVHSYLLDLFRRIGWFMNKTNGCSDVCSRNFLIDVWLHAFFRQMIKTAPAVYRQVFFDAVHENQENIERKYTIIETVPEWVKFVVPPMLNTFRYPDLVLHDAGTRRARPELQDAYDTCRAELIAKALEIGLYPNESSTAAEFYAGCCRALRPHLSIQTTKSLPPDILYYISGWCLLRHRMRLILTCKATLEKRVQCERRACVLAFGNDAMAALEKRMATSPPRLHPQFYRRLSALFVKKNPIKFARSLYYFPLFPAQCDNMHDYYIMEGNVQETLIPLVDFLVLNIPVDVHFCKSREWKNFVETQLGVNRKKLSFVKIQKIPSFASHFQREDLASVEAECKRSRDIILDRKVFRVPDVWNQEVLQKLLGNREIPILHLNL